MIGEDKDNARGGKARTWNGRYVNIAHRRTPSELTPLIQQNLALQQQVELLTAQNQHMMHQQMTAQYLSPQQPPPGPAQQSTVPAVPQGVFVAQTQLLPPPPQVFHHRGGSHASAQLSPTNSQHSRQRSMGHARRHSLAVSEAKRAAQERSAGGSPTLGAYSQHAQSPSTPASLSSATFGGSPSGAGSPGPLLESTPQFRFPPSPDRAQGSAGPPPTERTGRGHGRSQSTSSFHRHATSPQRFQFPPAAADNNTSSGPGSSTSGSSSSSHNNSWRSSGWRDESTQSYGHRPRPSNASDFSPNQQQAGRKSLFVPYLPQSAIPEMLSEGLLITGTLRVNHKNRSYAYVTTDLLDADVFIAGSKDRNRALEGDIVAVELLDVDDVWEQKREKEERKRRRGVDASDSRLVETQEGQLRRRGSLKQRAPQKRSDDVEVEGQTLLLREDFGTGEEKPLYSGHVVAILERPAGQLFSGTLGLLRPSSQANKERHHQRQESTSSITGDDVVVPTTGGNNNNNSNSNNNNNNNNRPKIVWFKPVDKCVPLMAIPTEQAPPDLIENPQNYANQIFVAQIKRWPITSLHPFGMLVEKLGPFGEASVAQKAILRDFNFGAHKFDDGAVEEAVEAGRAMSEAAKHLPASHEKTVWGIAPDLSASTYEKDGEQIVAVHVLDITPFIERNGLLDRELRHKSAGVYMDGFESPLVASSEALEQIRFKESRLSPAITVELAMSTGSFSVKREAVMPAEERFEDLSSAVAAKFENAASVLRRRRGLGGIDDPIVDLSSLLDVVTPTRPPLSDPSRSELIIGELMHAANAAVASELLRSSALGLNTLVRRQAEPPLAKLEKLADLLRSQDIRVDTTNGQTLAKSLAESLTASKITAIKASLIKSMNTQRYAVAARTNPGQLGHYWFGFDAYTHFVRPLLRYADQVVARQVHTMLGTESDISNEQFVSAAADLAPELSFRYECAHRVQEQSFHLALAQSLSKSFQLVIGVVTAVYDSAFDVVIPEFSVEKRVHGDQLPLKKAEYHPSSHLLELYWNKDVDSASFEPEGDDASSDGSKLDQEVTATTQKVGVPPLSDEVRRKLVLREEGNVQEIRVLSEVPVLIGVAFCGRVLPSIIVRAANPFLA